MAVAMAGVVKRTLKCFISCILPCGAFDVVRIIHSDGHLQELTGTIRAAEIMELYPQHILRKLSSHWGEVRRGVVVVPPNAKLRRGEIYFLAPLPERTPRKREARRSYGGGHIKIPKSLYHEHESLIQKSSSRSGYRRRRAGVWQPRLDSISETQ